MNGSERTPEHDARRADQGGERRQQDRRRQDRRAPLPVWRRPLAFVLYGILGAFLVLSLVTRLDGDGEPAATRVDRQMALPAIDTSGARAASAPVVDAFGAGGYASLLADGEEAVGRRVRTELFCESIRQVTLRSGSGLTVHASVAEHVDRNGRVTAADCRWGSDSSAPTVLLVVPPPLAASFAAAPEVEQSFVRRRRLVVDAEWVGRSDALALRTALVLRAIAS